MEAWLIPVSLFTKKYLSISTLAILPLLVYLAMFAYLLLTKRDSLHQIKVSKGMFAFVLVFLAVQTIIIFFTFNRVKNDPSSPNLFSGVFFGVYLLMFNFIIIAMLTKTLITGYSKISSFYRSVYWTIILYGLVVLLPQLMVVTIHFGAQWVNFLASLFEEQHPGRIDFYYNGSYATTLGRINGFSSEASFLAAQVGIIFLPVLLSSIKNRVNITGFNNKYYKFINWGLLIFLWVILLFAKTSTGILVIVLSVLMLFFTASISEKVVYFVLGIFASLILVIGYLKIGPLKEIIDNYLLHKSGVSNRLGGTIGLIITFFHHPFFGVGTGYESYYLMKFVPAGTTDNWEFLNVFTKSGYPVQSVIPDLFARYGLIIMLPVTFYIGMKIQSALKLKKYINITNVHDEYSDLGKVTIDAFLIFIVMYLIIGLFSFGWYNSCYFVMFFFYIVSLNLVKNNYLNQSYKGVK